MSDLIVIGTDTNVGKTTFALLWLTAFGDQFAYWKPVETGESDSKIVQRLVPKAQLFPTVAHFAEPVAPPLAAQLEGRTIPSARDIAAMRPHSERPLVIETFGSALSPLNENELQIELIKQLRSPSVLVADTSVGVIGRTLASIRNLRGEQVTVIAVVLIGPSDDFAAQEIHKHGEIEVFSIEPPETWNPHGLAESCLQQCDVLTRLLRSLKRPPTDPDSEDSEDSPNELVGRDSLSVWHPYSPLPGSHPPLPVVAAQDEFLELADGRKLIDAISSWWTILHGHRHPRLMNALRNASEKIDHVLFAGVTHPAAVECAEMLLATAPWTGGRVFFSDNGSTAVEVALKMAYQFWCHRGEPQRTIFVGFEGGYHGDTFGAMAVGRDPLFFGRFEPLLFKSERVPVSADRLDEVLTRFARKSPL